MDNLPTGLHPDAAKVAEPEIVGSEPTPLPLGCQRVASRLVFSLVLGGVGLCALILGAILTITIVGAIAGIPMVLLGLSLVLVAIIVGLGGGRFITIRGTDQ